jgi:hypothetical protein
MGWQQLVAHESMNYEHQNVPAQAEFAHQVMGIIICLASQAKALSTGVHALRSL